MPEIDHGKIYFLAAAGLFVLKNSEVQQVEISKLDDPATFDIKDLKKIRTHKSSGRPKQKWPHPR